VRTFSVAPVGQSDPDGVIFSHAILHFFISNPASRLANERVQQATTLPMALS